jgi:hypothetical protein
MKRAVPLAYCFAAGCMDVATGILLMAAPAFTLKLMLVADPLVQPVFLRFVGAFVAGLGSLYFLALLRRFEPGRLAAIMEATSLVRAIIAVFVTVSVAWGPLSPPWLSVAATDAGLAIAQIVMLRRGMFADVS